MFTFKNSSMNNPIILTHVYKTYITLTRMKKQKQYLYIFLNMRWNNLLKLCDIVKYIYTYIHMYIYINVFYHFNI